MQEQSDSQLLNELELRSMVFEVEKEYFSSDELLDLYGINSEHSYKEMYGLFLLRVNEEHTRTEKNKESLKNLHEYSFGTPAEIRNKERLREIKMKEIEQYPETIEKIVEGVLERDMEKIRYSGIKKYLLKAEKTAENLLKKFPYAIEGNR